MIHEFKGTVQFTGGYGDYGQLNTSNLDTKISIPKSMGGIEIGTNPDELLLGAAATCFIISLSVICERSKISLNDLLVNATAFVEFEHGVLTYKAIEYDVLIEPTHEVSGSLVKRLIDKAEKNCMITRALKGNVDVRVKSIKINQST